MGSKGSKSAAAPETLKMPQPVVVSPSTKHSATVIFLHGLGDTGHGWADTIASIRPSHVKVICPTAGKMPVTLNSGFAMPSWFDLYSLDPAGKEDEAGIKRAAQQVELLVAEEVKAGIPADRIVLGGFSQGGALALYTALHSHTKLAGVVALSCWLPLHKQLDQSKPANQDTPILQAHGDCDPVVPFKWGQMTSQLLKEKLGKHEFKTYKGMMHSSSPDELDDMKDFFRKILS